MKKYKILILISLMMVLPIKVSALSGNIEINCSPNSINPGGTTNCTVSVEASENVTAISANIELSENLSFVSFDANDNWTDNSTSSKIDISTDNDISGSFTIGVIQVNASNDATDGSNSIKLTSVSLYDEDDNAVDIVGATASIKINTLKGLKSLSVGNGTISPIFDTSITDYSAVITSNTFNLTLEAINSSDKINVSEGEMFSSLNPSSITFQPNQQGMMLINVLVGSGERLVTYTLIVRKDTSGDENDYDNTLASLTVGSKKVNLVDNKFDYVVTLGSNSSYVVKATLSDPDNFEFDNVNDGNGTFSGNSFIVIINPKDATSGAESVTYRITVKESTSSSSGSTGGSSSGGNSYVSENPDTSDISAFVMAIVLITSLVISIFLYRKNMSYYT